MDCLLNHSRCLSFFLSKLSLTDVTDVTETRTKTILATVIVKWAKTASNFNRKSGSTRNCKKEKTTNLQGTLKNTEKIENNRSTPR
jgi:hypothetical protein